MQIEVTQQDYDFMYNRENKKSIYVSQDDYSKFQKWISLFNRGFVYDAGCAEFFTGYEKGTNFCLQFIRHDEDREDSFKFYVYDTEKSISDLRKDEEFYSMCMADGDVNHNIGSLDVANIKEAKRVIEFFEGNDDYFPCTACGFINSNMYTKEFCCSIPKVIVYKVFKEQVILSALDDVNY